MQVATAIAAQSGANVEVEHQVLTGYRVANPDNQEKYDLLKDRYPESAAVYLEAVWEPAPE